MPVITISRQIGSGGSMLAEKLGNALGYRVIDKVILTRAAQLAGVSEERFAELERQGPQGVMERILRTIARGLPNLDHYYRAFAEMENQEAETAEFAYYGHTHEGHKRLQREDVVRFFEAAIREMAQRGDVIILGRGGQMVLRDMPHTLHIRVTGDLDSRTARIAAIRHLSPAHARKAVEDEDAKRLGYLSENYKRSANDALLYDLVLRLGRFDLDETVEFICRWAVQEHKQQHEPFEKQS